MQHRPRLRVEAGVGLIEILIAVLVLSIGILGLANLQTRALANNSSSMSRSLATIASYSIIDAMRADRANALAGSYNTTVTAGSCNFSNTPLAQYQLQQWCLTYPTAVSAVGTIYCSNIGDCTVTITYNDTTSGKGKNESIAQTVITQAVL